MSIKAIVFDRTPNTSTGMTLGRQAIVGNGFVTEGGDQKEIEMIVEQKDQHDRPIIIITCTDGYQIIIPDRNIYKELEFK